MCFAVRCPMKHNITWGSWLELLRKLHRRPDSAAGYPLTTLSLSAWNLNVMATVSPAILHCEAVLRLEAKHQCWRSSKESQSPMNTAFRSWAMYFQVGERKKLLSHSNDLSIVICKQILLLILNIASALFLKKVVSLEPMRCFNCWPCKFIINYSTHLTGCPSPFFSFSLLPM